MTSKYGNIPVEVDGIRFASKREAKRYSELKLLERAGKIRNLQLQPAFPIIINKMKVCTYRADFAYAEDSRRVIEDAKGMKTPVYRLKKALMRAVYGVDVQEV